MLKWVFVLILVALAVALLWRQIGPARGGARDQAGFDDR